MANFFEQKKSLSPSFEKKRLSFVVKEALWGHMKKMAQATE